MWTNNAKASLLVLLLPLFISSVATLKNMALNKTAKQSSLYHRSWTADTAVDGNRNNSLTENNPCAVTADDGQSTVWWQVDLGLNVRIDHIYLVYRTQYQHRLAGFTVFVSNGTNWNNGEICFNYSSESLLPTTINITCEYTARYVTMYNERTGMFPSTYSPKAFIELCELEVYGCPELSFGVDCKEICHCDSCNPNTGTCDSSTCYIGWQGEKCDKVCMFQTFGDQCSNRCFCKAGNCHHITGICDNRGCQHGWNGKDCTTACTNNTFGPDCAEECHCLDGGCDTFYGNCLQSPGLCQSGWTGQSCSEVCRNKSFGVNCTGLCGDCYEGKSCNYVTGFCENGCNSGFREPYCNECNNGIYGDKCDKICGEFQQSTNFPAIALGCTCGILLVSQIVTCVLLKRLRRTPDGNIGNKSGDAKTGQTYTNTIFDTEDAPYYEQIHQDAERK